MKKYGLILGILLLGAAGYFTYKWWTRSLAAWKYIPTSASIILTSNHLQDSVFLTRKDGLDCKKLPVVQLAAANLSIVNWFNNDPAQVAAFLKDKTVTYSYHPLSGNRFGVIMYIPVSGEKEEQWLENPKIGGVRSTQHTFQEQQITDVTNEKSQLLFSYIRKGGYLIVSQYGELIEDVIRKSAPGFFSLTLQSKFELTDDAQYDLNIYTKNKSWKEHFLPQGLNANLDSFLELLPDFQDYHLEKEPSGRAAAAFRSLGTTVKSNLYSEWFDGQKGGIFSNHRYISQQTTYLLRASGADREKFQRNYLKWARNRNNDAPMKKLGQLLGSDTDVLLNNIGSEFILCLNERNNSLADSKIMLVDFANYDKIKPVLTRLSKSAGASEKTAVSNFQGYAIHAIPIAELPQTLFGPVFKGFPEAYVTYVAPYLVIGNNSQSVRNYLIDYENQLTWAQSPEYDSLGVGSGTEAQLSLIVNFRKAAVSLSQNPAGGTYLPGTLELTSVVENMVVECRFSGTTLYTNVALNKKRSLSSGTVNETTLKVDIEWPVVYDSSFTAMLNPVDGISEILLTDKEHHLLEINDHTVEKPQVLTRLDGPLVTKTYKSDFLNIGRQQRIVCTSNRLYAIDEDDSGIVTPLSAPITSPWRIDALYRVNGGSESSSRFIVKDIRENLYLWERVNKPPFKLNNKVNFDGIRPPVISFEHGNDNLFCVTQRNGKIYVLNENGTPLKGFPVDILSRTQGPFTWTQNPVNSEIELLGVTPLGELIRIDLNGKIVQNKQLLRPEPNCVFRTLYDDNSLDWLLLRTTGSKAAILGKDGEVQFEIVNLLPNSEIRYHFFGSDNRFISVRSGRYTSVFDFNGRRLGDKPIPSASPVSLTYQASRYELLVFSRAENKIQLWSIKLR